MEFGIGIDVGGTQLKSAAFDLATGERLGDDVEPTRDGEVEDGLPAWAAGALRVVRRLEETHGQTAKAIGISAPGVADPDGSCIRHLPVKLQGVEGFDWREHLGLGAVWVLNDAHAALLGEAWCGAAKGKEHAFLLTLGTGVGGAILSDGKLMMGRNGRAGHLGQTSLNPDGELSICNCPGSIENAIGNWTVPMRSGGRFQNTRELVDAVNAGDAEAEAMWEKSCKALAASVASFINICDPEVGVIGGGIAAAGDQLFDRVRRHLEEFEWQLGGETTPIVPAELGDWAGCYGAVYKAAGLGG